jgi:hypothetical protein
MSRTPSSPELHAQRRNAGGARREASERVLLRNADFEARGWTLNVSRGGLRAILEDHLMTGVEYELVLGEEEGSTPRRVSAVWAQDEADGQIVGLKYLDTEGSIPPQDP